MNGQISNYSAAYSSRSGGGAQAGAVRPQQPMMGGTQGTSGSGMTGARQEAQPMPGIAFAAAGAGGERQETPPQGITFPGAGMQQLADMNQAQPASAESLQYMNGFLRTQIGNRIRVEFLVGTNTYLEKAGKLMAVGANYIILQEAMSDDLLVCDFFNIKFVTIYR